MAETLEFQLELTGGRESAGQVEEFNAALRKSGAEAERSKRPLRSFGDVLSGMGTAAVVATGAIAGLTGAAAALGNELERRAGIWNRFTGDISETRTRTAGLVTELQAMAAANQLAARGIQTSGQDLNNILVAAFEQASATGEDFESVLGRLTEALGSGSQDTLRNFGLEMEQGKTATENTTSALAQLEERFGSTNLAADSAGGRIRQLGNAADDAATRFLEAVNDTGELDQAFEDLFTTVVGGATDFDDAIDRMLSTAVRFGAIAGEAISRVSRLVQQNIQIWQAIGRGDFEEAGRLILENAADFVTEARSLLDGSTLAAADNRVAGLQDRQRDRRTRGRSRGRTRITNPQAANDNGGRTLDDLMGDAAGDRFFDDLIEEAPNATDAWLEAYDAIEAKEQALHDKQKEHLQEQQELREALFEKQKEAARESEEAFRRNAQEIEAFTQPIVSGLTRALSEVIAGAKTADQAFQGLLSSFLEMIAQQTALQAAKEFAEAIAAFASQQYDKGALHLAAGVAFTGVAIAAGAASIAVAPAAAAPASPEAGQSSGGGGGGGTTVVNVNGPILSAGNRAGRQNLGRELGQIIRDGEGRYRRVA